MNDLNDYFTDHFEFEDFESDVNLYAQAFAPGYFAVKVDYATGGWQPARSGTMVAHWETEEFIKSVTRMGGEYWRVAYKTNIGDDSKMVIHSIHHDGRDTITVSSLPEADNDLWEALEARDEATYENLVLLADLTQARRAEVKELVLQRGYSPSGAVDALDLVHA